MNKKIFGKSKQKNKQKKNFPKKKILKLPFINYK